MYGEIPKEPVVFAACDSKYFIEHGAAFVYSVTRFKNCHIHVVNPTDEVFSLGTLLAGTSENRVTFTFSDVNFTGQNSDGERTYYACLRFFVLPTILQSAEKVLVLDIDCLLMKDFEWPKQSIGFFAREPLPNSSGWEREGTRVAAGAVYFDRSAFSKAVDIEKLLYKMLKDGQFRWFVDQYVLHEVLWKNRRECLIFDSEFMDWEFQDGSVIWTGKGPRKYENKTYVGAKESFSSLLKKKVSAHQTILLAPRLDTSFKKTGLFFAGPMLFPSIREHWSNFVKKKRNDDTLVITMPNWMFNSTLEKWIDESVELLVPHKERHNWGGSHQKTQFYMQTVFPFLFTIDPIGWGGGASFCDQFDPESEYSSEAFEQMSAYVKSGKTKFDQPSSKCHIEPGFVLVPLQLPHDETIKYHSEISVELFVEKIAKWASKKDVRVVFKGHPVNLASMTPLKAIIEKHSHCQYVDQYSLTGLMEKALCVFVINSGTGQEAMLLDKPVVAFGRSEYSSVVLKGDIENLDKTLEMVYNTSYNENYRKWFHWFINTVCFDTRK